MEVDPQVEKAFQEAIKTQNNAYAPYSNFNVGAAIKVKGQEKVFYGCNVENASYGATVCAERTAIQSSVAALGKTEFEFLIVVTNTDPAIGPCGLCLQVISEFCGPDFPIYLANPKGIQKKVLFKDILSSPFSEIPDQV